MTGRTNGRMIALFMFAAIILTACSTGGQTPQAGNGNPAVESAAPVESAAEAPASAAASPIVVKHAMGEATLDRAPERVVVLDNGALDNLLALGVMPVGAPTVQLDDPFPAYLSGQTDGIENVGLIDEPNLESIAALQPDLILGSKDTHEAIYEKLNAIAPTVFVETLGYTWKENLTLQGLATGKAEEAARLLEAYHERLDSFKTEMGGELADIEVSVLRPRTDHVRAYLRQSFSGIIVEDAGLKRPSSQQADDFAVQLTEEQVAEMAGDVILWFSRDTDNLLQTKLSSNPLWKKLEAVQNGKVYEVDAETWLSGLGVQAANKVVDDLFKLLAGK